MEEGMIVVNYIVGKVVEKFDYDLVFCCIYIFIEIVSVGIIEE